MTSLRHTTRMHYTLPLYDYINLFIVPVCGLNNIYKLSKNSVPRLLFPPLTGAETTMLAPDNYLQSQFCH